MACTLPPPLPYESLPSLALTRDVGRERWGILHPSHESNSTLNKLFIVIELKNSRCYKLFIVVELKNSSC